MILYEPCYVFRVFFGGFSGATSYEMVTNANLDNTGLAYSLPLLHKKMWSITELEEEHIEHT